MIRVSLIEMYRSAKSSAVDVKIDETPSVSTSARVSPDVFAQKRMTCASLTGLTTAMRSGCGVCKMVCSVL